VFHFPIQRQWRINPLLITVFLILEVAGKCDAQFRETTLGILHTIATPDSFGSLREMPAHEGTTTSFILWNSGLHDFCIVHVDSSFGSLSVERHTFPSSFDDILIGTTQVDSNPALFFLDRTDRTINIVTNLEPDTLAAVSTISLPFAPTEWRIGDINNDGITDILIFDHNNPGIVPFIGRAKWKFTTGKTIAPELAVGCIAFVRLNNDNLIDIVAYDWVKSELHLLYGVGYGRFLDQSTFKVQGEVARILPARVDPTSALDLVLVTQNPAELQDWQGNGLGDFRLTKRAALGENIVSCALGDVNCDGWNDFGSIGASSGFEILLNNGEEWSPDRIQFAAGKDPRQVLFQDFNHDRKTDAVILDRSGKSLRFYFNGTQPTALRDSLEYATAAQPAGVAIYKAGYRKGNDVALVNTKARTLSLFSDGTKGGFPGQTAFPLSLNPQSLTFHSLTDSSARFIVTSNAGDSLLVLSLNFKDSSSSYAVIPSEGATEVVQTGVTSQNQVEFFTFNTYADDRTPAIHYYERLNPGTFIEQSFRLNKPDELLGATASLINADTYPDLVYIYRNLDSNTVDLAVSYGDSLLTYSQRHSSITLPQVPIARSYLWTASLARNDTADLLIYFGAPSNTLQCASGKGSGQFDEPVVVLRNVQLFSRSMLQIVDVNNDGRPDIVLNNGAAHEIGWISGNGNGTFGPWTPLVAATPRTSFAVGDLNDDGIPDLVLTQSAQGAVKMYNGGNLFIKGGHEPEP
jgi:hypothetical protein